MEVPFHWDGLPLSSTMNYYDKDYEIIYKNLIVQKEIVNVHIYIIYMYIYILF